VASKRITSGAVARRLNDFIPCSVELEARAQVRVASSCSRRAAASGSAAVTLPASTRSNRIRGSRPSTRSASAASTLAAAVLDRWRVAWATARTSATRAVCARTRAHSRGSR